MNLTLRCNLTHSNITRTSTRNREKLKSFKRFPPSKEERQKAQPSQREKNGIKLIKWKGISPKLFSLRSFPPCNFSLMENFLFVLSFSFLSTKWVGSQKDSYRRGFSLLYLFLFSIRLSLKSNRALAEAAPSSFCRARQKQSHKTL